MLALAQLAATQHGLVSRAQALASGFSSTGLSRALAAGRLKAIDAGVYAVPPAQKGFKAEVMAACLSTGGCASHRTAAALWGLPVEKGGPIEVLVPADRRPRSTKGLRVYRTRAPVAAELRDQVPTAPLKDTLLHIGLDVRRIDAALRVRPGILYDLADTLVEARRGHRKAIVHRDLIIELLPDDDARAKLAAVLPPATPHPVLDFAYPKHRVGVALFDHRDHGQGAALDALTDWKVLVTHAKETPAALARRVRRHFQ